MRRTTKAIASVLLSLLLTFSCLTGCSAPKSSSQTDDAEYAQLQLSREKLLTDWFQLLEVHETIYSDIFRTLDYIQMFTWDSSWESLLKARASASAAQVTLRQMELPVLTMTSEEISLLLPEDGDSVVFQQEFEMMEALSADKDMTVSLLCDTLENDVFLRACVEDAVPTMVEFYREYFTYEYRYMCQFTNYLLLKLDCTEIWEDWKTSLPCMASCVDIWYDDIEKLQEATKLLQDTMNALRVQQGSMLGTSEFTLEIVQDAVQTGDLEVLQREIKGILNVPGYFPIPAWLPDVQYLYLLTDTDTGEKRMVNRGEELISVPSACYINCGTIPLEDAEAYAEQLAKWNIQTYCTWNNEKDSFQILVNSGSSTMMVEWTPEETLLYLTEPVGCLIPELYLQAMITK